MKKFELKVLALVKRRVVVEISEKDYEYYSEDELTPIENIKGMYDDDKYCYFENIEEDCDTEHICYEEVLSVKELPKGEEENV